MQRREKPPPKAAKILELIKELDKEGKVATHGELCRLAPSPGNSKNAVAESVARLVKLRWVKRGKYRQGCKRPIKLL